MISGPGKRRDRRESPKKHIHIKVIQFNVYVVEVEKLILLLLRNFLKFRSLVTREGHM